MRRAISRAILLGAFAALAVGGNSSAASSGGAVHAEDHSCVPTGGGFTSCTDISSVSNFVQTPSGNVVITSRVEFTFTTTGPGGYRESNTGKAQNVIVLRKGETQVSHHLDRSEVFPAAGGVCTVRSLFQFANGEVRVAITEFECSPTG